MINVITSETIDKDLFNQIINDPYDTSYKEHRRGSNFYTKWVFEVNEEYFPDHLELWGFWESNDFIFDDEYGLDDGDIYQLTRVEKKTKTIVEEYWAEVGGDES